jgi:hypothetical protein
MGLENLAWKHSDFSDASHAEAIAGESLPA